MVATLRKGNRWRVKVAEMLATIGLVEKRGLGDAGDDLTVWIHGLRVILSVECKNEQEQALARWITQAEGQAPRGRLPVVVAHRRARESAEDGYVIMSGRTFVRLVSELTNHGGRG